MTGFEIYLLVRGGMMVAGCAMSAGAFKYINVKSKQEEEEERKISEWAEVLHQDILNAKQFWCYEISYQSLHDYFPMMPHDKMGKIIEVMEKRGYIKKNKNSMYQKFMTTYQIM